MTNRTKYIVYSNGKEYRCKDYAQFEAVCNKGLIDGVDWIGYYVEGYNSKGQKCGGFIEKRYK